MTIDDIAKLAGVSKGTVSRVINNSKDGVSDETRRKILEIIEAVGYVPNRMARSITVSETKTIGLMIPDVQNPFFPQVVRGVEDYAMKYGYTVFLCNSDSNVEKEQTYLYDFLEKRVDGIIINTSGELNNPKLISLIKNSKIPVVLLDRKIGSFSEYPGVYVNNMEASYKGTLYLLHNGNKNIAFLGGTREVYTSEERYHGFLKAHEESNVPVREDLVSFEAYNIQSGYERTLKLMKNSTGLDAIFAGSDIIAVGVLKALHEQGVRVPEEIEILGFDNIWICDVVTPTLSTIGQPAYDIGYIAARKLIAAIMNKELVQEDEYLETQLILRESTRTK